MCWYWTTQTLFLVCLRLIKIAITYTTLHIPLVHMSHCSISLFDIGVHCYYEKNVPPTSTKRKLMSVIDVVYCQKVNISPLSIHVLRHVMQSNRNATRIFSVSATLFLSNRWPTLVIVHFFVRKSRLDLSPGPSKLRRHDVPVCTQHLCGANSD